jgi:hypothetical protein
MKITLSNCLMQRSKTGYSAAAWDFAFWQGGADYRFRLNFDSVDSPTLPIGRKPVQDP